MFKKILIPTDGSALATEAARAGVEFARQINAEIFAFFVAQEYKYPMYIELAPVDLPTEEDYRVAMQKEGEAAIDTIKKFALEAKLPYSGQLVFSDEVDRQIIAAVEKYGCDLIIMGSHGRSGWGRLLLGSVTAKVLAACQIPVLVYRSKNKMESTLLK